MANYYFLNKMAVFVLVIISTMMPFSKGVSYNRIAEINHKLSTINNVVKGPQVDCSITFPSNGTDIKIFTLANNTGDYTVNSVAYPGYSYDFNICRELLRPPAGCDPAAVVCERKRLTHEGVSDYGLISTTKLSWKQGSVVMNLTGQDCQSDPSKKLQTRIYFVCAEGMRGHPVSLRSESYENCLLELEMKTSLVCEAPTPPPSPPTPPSPPADDKYHCTANKCELSTDGSGISKSACETVCTAPTPPPGPPVQKYMCQDDRCAVSADGSGVTKDECEKTCKAPPPPPSPPADDKYHCTANRCQISADGSGISKSACESVCTAPTPPPGPPVQKYMCQDDRCAVSADGSGVTKEECEKTCKAPPPPPSPPADDKYHCTANKCVVATDGKGISKSACETVCTAPTQKYMCQDDRCAVSADGSGVTKEECDKTCSPPAEDKYHCQANKCVVATDGTGISKASCETVCAAPTPDTYKCKDTKCVVEAGGFPKETCESVCQPSNSFLHA